MGEVRPITSVTFHGLTHECDDPACHVVGFVMTLLDPAEEA